MRGNRAKNKSGLITATEIACFAYCPEQWRLQYGLELPAENQAALDAGDRHHARKAVAEQIAGGLITLGRFLAVLAAVVPRSSRSRLSGVLCPTATGRPSRAARRSRVSPARANRSRSCSTWRAVTVPMAGSSCS